MKMSKKKFRIGTLATKLALERFVIRFWEQEFELNKNRALGTQRYYDEDDLKTFLRIKDLLYAKGFTIAGAKKELLSSCGPKIVPTKEKKSIVSTERTIKVAGALNVSEKAFSQLQTENEHLSRQIANLQNHLKKLQKLL